MKKFSWLLLFFPLISNAAIEAYLDAHSYEQGDDVVLYIDGNNTDYEVKMSKINPKTSVINKFTKIYGNVPSTDQALLGTDDVDRYETPQSFVNALTVPLSATQEPGWYQFDITVADDTAVIHFAVRDSTAGSHSAVLMLDSAPTGTVYNTWGGRHTFPNAKYFAIARPDKDFDQYGYDADDHGQWMLHGSMVSTGVYFERMGMPYESASMFDVHDDNTLLGNYEVVIIAGSSEHWSMEMKNNLESYQDAGGDVISLSSPTMRWQIRIDDTEPVSHVGEITAYMSDDDDPIDPDCVTGCFGVTDATKVTNQWRVSADGVATPEYEAELLGASREYGGHVNDGEFPRCVIN